MIRELGNVELFELCETIPKVQCSQCVLYWNQGMISCTCGQFLVESESRRKLYKLRLDALSIPHYVIKKGRCHGARHGKTEEQKEYQKAWNAWKRCCKRVDSQGEHCKGIHDRILRDQVHRDQIFELQSLSKTVFIVNQVRKLQNQYLHSNTGDGTLPQAIPGETRPKVDGAHDKCLRGRLISFLLQCVSFTVDGDPL